MNTLKLGGMTALGLVLTACGGSSNNSGTTTPPPPVNAAPVASDGSETLLQNSDAISITLAATDADGDTLTYNIGTQPTSGTISLSGNVVSYTPDAGFSGTDSFTFTVNDGTVNSNAATVNLTVQPISNFQGRLTQADGTVIPNVSVEALDGAGDVVTATTSDVDGAFTLTAVTEQALVLNFLSDDYANQVLPVTMPALKSINLPLDITLIKRGESQTIDIDAGGTLSGANGASVTLTAGSFVDENDAAVTGNITTQITPVDISNPLILAAFPGDFKGIEEMNNTETSIVSLGTVEYVFTQNGMPLQLSNGATAEIQLPIYDATNPQTGDPIEMGDEVELWSLNEDTGIWLQEGTGTVVANTDSPTGLALRATVSHFTWWNIDVPIPTADVDITLSGTVTGGAAVIHARAPSDFGGYRTATHSVFVGSTTSGLQIPADRETCFWIEYVDMSGATALSDEQCISNAVADSTYPLTFSVSTAGSLSLTSRQSKRQGRYFVETPLSIDFFPRSLESSVGYTITSGTLPTGLSLTTTSATTAKIIGSTAAIGNYSVTVEGTDSDAFTDTQTVTFSIVDTLPPSLRGVSTVYAAVGDPVSTTIGVNNNGGDDPTSWIVTQSDGSPVPAGVSISSTGVFSIDSFDGTAASYVATAYNIKGASNAVTINVLDVATSPPVLPSGYGWTHDIDISPNMVSLASLNTGAPATSWTITLPNGAPVPSGVSITNAGVVTYIVGAMGSSVDYHVTAYNGTLASDAMNLNIYFDSMMDDPCSIDPNMCGGGF